VTKQYAFYFDANLCIDCKVCQIACQDTHNLPGWSLWRRVFEYSGGTWVTQDNVLIPSGIYTYAVSISCMHCQEPICVEVCPTGAMHKREDGIVLIDESKCVGCRYCQWSCPYGAPAYREDLGVMTKCTFCENLLAQGQNPACVDACVMRALDYGELDELRSKYGDLAETAPLPTADITRPSFVVTPNRRGQPSVGGTGRVIDLKEEF
jgi:anaerobic dimethyl sulfoxide reductase subunit B (iron-sulfur subunit)